MTARRTAARGAATKTMLLSATAAIGCLGVSGVASAQETDCASLKALTLENVRIDVAEAIVTDPVWPYPPT